MPQEPVWKELVERLNALFENKEESPKPDAIRKVLSDEPAANIALAIEEMEPENALTVFKSLEKSLQAEVLPKLDSEQIKEILRETKPHQLPDLIEPLAPREAASVLSEAPTQQLKTYLNNDQADPSAVKDVEQRLQYPKETVGRLMTTHFVRLQSDMTIEEALDVVKHTNPDVDIPNVLFVVRPGKNIPENKNR